MNPNENQTQPAATPPNLPETPQPQPSAPVQQPQPYVTPVEPPASPAEVAQQSPFQQATPAIDPAPQAPQIQPTGVIGSASSSTSPISQPQSPQPTIPHNQLGGSGKKKNLLIGIIIGAVLLLAGAAVAIYFLFFSLSKSDYVDAQTQLSTLSEGAITLTSVNDEESATQAQNELEVFKERNAKLASMKVFRLDEDLQSKYKAYEEKARAYTELLDDMLPSMVPYLKGMEKISARDAEFSSAYFRSVLDSLKEIRTEIKSSTLQAFMDDIIKSFEDMAQAIEVYEKSNSSSDATKIINIATEMSNKTEKFAKEMEESFNAVNPEQAYNELRDAVNAKVESL